GARPEPAVLPGRAAPPGGAGRRRNQPRGPAPRYRQFPCRQYPGSAAQIHHPGASGQQGGQLGNPPRIAADVFARLLDVVRRRPRGSAQSKATLNTNAVTTATARFGDTGPAKRNVLSTDGSGTPVAVTAHSRERRVFAELVAMPAPPFACYPMDLAPSRDSQMMSAGTACWAVSAITCSSTRRAAQRAPCSNQGAPGSGWAASRSGSAATNSLVRRATCSYSSSRPASASPSTMRKASDQAPMLASSQLPIADGPSRMKLIHWHS